MTKETKVLLTGKSVGAHGKGSLLVTGKEEAKSWINHWNGWGNFTGSEYLPGKNLGFDCVWKDGKFIKGHVKERIAYALAGSVPSGISGTAGTMKSLDRIDVEEVAKAAILALDSHPNGVFAVDLKENEDGKPYITEVNAGRFLTSSLHFFAKVNYPLPYLYLKVAYGENFDFNFPYPKGTYMIRSLDCEPIIFDESYVESLSRKRENNAFFEV